MLDCKDSPIGTICGLIQSVQQERAAKEAEAKEKLRAELKVGHDYLDQTLGPLLAELMPYTEGAPHYGQNREGELDYVEYRVAGEGLPILGLLPFAITYRPYRAHHTRWNDETAEGDAPGSVSLSYRRDEYHITSKEWNERAVFFAELHDLFLEQQESKRQEQIKSIAKKISHDAYNYDKAQNRSDATAALAQIIALDPANESKWRSHYAAWERDFEKGEREQAESARREAARKVAQGEELSRCQINADTYRAAYSEYWRRVGEVRQHNAERIAVLQAKLDRETFIVYQLTYALVARNDDGENYIEKDTAWVVPPSEEFEPTAPFWYSTLKDRAVKKVWFAHVIRIEEAETWIPSEHRAFCREIEFGGASNGTYSLWASPITQTIVTPEEADIWKEPPAPEEPSFPSHGWWAREIREKVEAGALASPATEEIPF